jgi:hypothetical protein
VSDAIRGPESGIRSSDDLGRRRAALCVALVGVFFFATFATCVRFGLPSRERIAAVTGAGAFTDTDIERMEEAQKALAASEGSTRDLLNLGGLYDTSTMSAREIDSLRAIRRMALYTTEPDEMHVPLALSRMKPRRLDFNPHFFQYGGLFFYGAGVFIALGGLLGFFPLSGGLGVFLRDPDAMAALYTAGRLWSVTWAALVPVVAYRLSRLGLPRRRAIVVAVLAALSPGVFAFAPVLKQISSASTAGLVAAWLGARVAARGERRDWIRAGAAVGVAGALFPTHLVLGLGIVVAALFAPGTVYARARGVATAAVTAAAVFVACNPYWLVDFRTVYSDAVVAMQWYKPNVAVDTVLAVLVDVLPAATGPGVALGALFILPSACAIRSPALRVLLAYSLIDLVYYGWRITGVDDLGPIWCRQFALIGPIWTVIVASILAARRTSRASTLGLALCVLLVIPSIPFDALIVRNFHRDASTASTRFAAGRWIERHVPSGGRIVVTQVPGPFSMPYFPLRNHEIVVTGDAGTLRDGDHVLLAGTANGYGMEAFFDSLTPVAEFSSERRVLGIEFPEAFGFANGPVRIWRK